MMSSYRLISVDVWDTLLRRRSHPECVKLHIGYYLTLKYPGRLRHEFPDRDSIYRERCRIELEIMMKESDRGQDAGYLLEDVFDRLLTRVLAGSIDPQERRVLKDELLARECDFEYSNTYVDPGIRAVLSRQSADKTIFLSDFYMTGPMIEQLLDRHGLLPVGGVENAQCHVAAVERSDRLGCGDLRIDRR